MRSLLLALVFAAVAAPSASLAAAAAPAGRTVTGTAVDPQGQPVAGAEVWLPPDVATDEEYAAYLHAGPAAMTGADGRFTVRLREDAEPAVDVCAPGSLTGQIDPGVSRLAGSLTAAGPLTVVVARAPGSSAGWSMRPEIRSPGSSSAQPLAGSSPSDLVMQSSPCNHSGIEAGAVSDAEGRFALEPLEPGWYTPSAVGGVAVESAPVRLAPGQVLGSAPRHRARRAGRRQGDRAGRLAGAGRQGLLSAPPSPRLMRRGTTGSQACFPAPPA